MSMTRRRFLGTTGAAIATAYLAKYGISSAKANQPVRIGGQGALSGAHADYGRQMRMGAGLAIEELNANGGILGRPVELNFVDEELNPTVATRNVRRLVDDWGADFLFGVDSSGSSMAVGPVLQEVDRICVFTHAATQRLTEELCYEQGIRQIFRASVPVYQDSILAARIFAEREDITRWANIGADYEYGRVCWALFKHELSRLRPDVEFVAEAWAPFQTIDFSGHVSSVMARRPDAVFATPWGGEAVTMLRAALLQGAFTTLKAWWQAMGGSVDALEGIAGQINQFDDKLWGTARYLFNAPEERTRAENDVFLAAFMDRWGRFPNYSAECSYAAVYSLAKACELAGTTDTAVVTEAMEGMEIVSPAGVRTYRAEDHQAVYSVPAGRIVRTDEWPIPVVGADMVSIPADDYYRHPPFDPIEL